jgi:hypothetical protein
LTRFLPPQGLFYTAAEVVNRLLHGCPALELDPAHVLVA